MQIGAGLEAQKEELEKNPIGIDIKEIDIDSIAPEDMELVEGYTTSDKIKQAIADLEEKSKGSFVVIEDFNGMISLVSDPETGETRVFDTSDEAFEEAKDCQNGKVIRL